MRANNIISELCEEQHDTRARLRAMEGMFDVLAEENPATSRVWQSVRPTVHREPTADEQEEMERWAVDQNSQLFDDFNS